MRELFNNKNAFKLSSTLILGLILLLSFSYIEKSVERFYLMNFKNVSHIKGVIRSAKETSSWDGVGYFCVIEYIIDNRNQIYEEFLPSNVYENLKPGSIVKIKFDEKKRLFTANSKSNILIMFLSSLLIIVLFIYHLVTSFFILKKSL